MARLQRMLLPLWAAIALALASPMAVVAETGDEYTMGAIHYREQRWQLAADEFREYLEQTPDGPHASEARFYRAECFVQLGQFVSAHQELVALLRAEPTCEFAAHARFRLGELAYLGGRTDIARQRLKQFCDERPSDANAASAYLYLGEIARERNQPADAIDYYEAALQRSPADALANRCRFGLANVLAEKGESESAQQLWQQVIDARSSLADDARLRMASLLVQQQQFDSALDLIAAVADDRADLIPHRSYWKGRALIGQGKSAEAAELWELAAARCPTHSLAARLQFEAGKAWRAAGDSEKAQSAWNKLLDEYAESDWADDAIVEITFTHLDSRQWLAAANEYRRLIAKCPESPRLEEAERRVAVALLEARQYALVIEMLAGESSSGAEYYQTLAEIGLERYQAALSRLERLQARGDSKHLTEELLVARISALFGAERYEEGQRCAALYVDAYPNGRYAPSCQLQQIRAALQANRLDEASRIFESFSSKHQDHSERVAVCLRLADAFFQIQDYSTARKHYQQCREMDARVSAETLIAEARCWLAEGDPARAAECLVRVQSAADFATWHADYYWLMAKIHERAEEHRAALEMYNNLLNLSPGPYSLDAQLSAARLLEKLERREEAARRLQRLADEFPDYAHHDSVLYEWAWVLIDLQQSESADQVFRRLYAAYPLSAYWPDASYRLAENAARRDDHELARELLNELLADGRNANVQAHAMYLLGQIAVREKAWDQVEHWMQRLLNEHPATSLRVQAEYWQAEAAYRQGDHAEAKERFEHMAGLPALDDQDWAAMIDLRRAQLLARRQQWAEALDVVEKLLADHPNFNQRYEADYLTGRCLMGLARFQEARVTFERVVHSPARHSETAAMAQWMIGETYMHQRHYHDALRAYHRVELRHNHPRWQAAAALQIGKCHEARNERQEAAAAYLRAAKQYGNSTYAVQARRRLNALSRSASATPRAQNSRNEKR